MEYIAPYRSSKVNLVCARMLCSYVVRDSEYWQGRPVSVGQGGGLGVLVVVNLLCFAGQAPSLQRGSMNSAAKYSIIYHKILF